MNEVEAYERGEKCALLRQRTMGRGVQGAGSLVISRKAQLLGRAGCGSKKL
jgi:hypothetical protein